MRRTLVLAALTVAAVAPLLQAAPASACDPNKFPYCTTYCRALLRPYDTLRAASDYELPPVPRTGLAGCP